MIFSIENSSNFFSLMVLSMKHKIIMLIFNPRSQILNSNSEKLRLKKDILYLQDRFLTMYYNFYGINKYVHSLNLLKK
jgi:hypothetical protein